MVTAVKDNDFIKLLNQAFKIDFFKRKIKQFKKQLIVIVLLGMSAYTWFNPYGFADLWLTKDQQGYILFTMGKYDLASQRFVNTRWKAFSLYGAEEYKQSGILYSQFSNAADLLAQANASAHGKEYVKARNLYQTILAQYPEYQPAEDNLNLVNEIIESINLMSESQRPEQGDSPKELGDEPQRADGAEKKEAGKQKIEQLSAEQLLQNPELNEMWLRQVQKNPAQFLGIKFQMQHEANKPINKVQEN